MAVSHVLQPHSAFAQQLRAMALRGVATYCQPIADDAVVRCDKIVGELYDNSRSGYRSKGNTKLLGSFSAEVVPSGGDFPVQIKLHSSCDPAKLWSLENGSQPHEISGSKPLVFPRGNTGSTTGGPRKRTKNFFGETGQLVRTPAVVHPGTKAGRFMEQGLASAIQARLRVGRGLTVGGR